MEAPKIEPTLENQIKFVEFMLEVNRVEILHAIKESLIELQKLKENK
jgi:hypothetical protein